MATYEMFWDCASCGTQKLLGKSHRRCPECGAPQDAARRYFPEEHEKVAVEDHVYVGRDYECAHCFAPNSRAAKHCVQCGAPIGDDDADVGLVQSGAGEEGAAPAAPPERPGFVKRFFGTPVRAILSLSVFLLVAVLIGGAATMFMSRDTVVEVTGHRWMRSIAIERYSAVSDSAWCDEMPSDAHGVTRSKRQRGKERVADGEECTTTNVDNGDGTFRQEESCAPRYREEPVYADWCRYTANRWVEEGSETASGTGRSPEPHWPSVDVSGCTSIGCTREGARREVYTVAYAEVGGEGEEFTCEFPLGEWNGMEKGARYSAEVRVTTGGLVCGSLQALR